MQTPSPATVPAPPGFTDESWAAFARDGILVIEDALSPAVVADLNDAVVRHGEDNPLHIVADDERFTELIDHPAHIGFVYDVYGEMLKLLRSEYFRREPGTIVRNSWHFDGPRPLPFSVFTGALPLRIKAAYWLTPLPTAGMGNLVFIRGSHRWDFLPEYQTHEPHPQEERLIVRPGALTLMWSGLWHRVDVNDSDTTRQNIFLEYGPSWVVTSDRQLAEPAWAAELSRERRILMRAYEEANECIKPPARDVPLYAPRDAGSAGSHPHYPDHVPLHLRKFSTPVEQRKWV
ncbi:phytanoyl-CoA dioxygenase family protein [Actinoplanes derwentensis]|uniref:Ectoine hydroxylase-related dioxygenase, phytanoyl-CoA dioxygenase (PhyH) family n=1 Tax=Actinoplanes derwentensis TaxID=113562 RepID=A0A1H2CCV6_9ACTN|nr:phytanoyl-CoA dioxygenase family protein [Actinoplanes derwentensis]GID87316.1 hypothetical protein Ade03nite_62400 [Actinoplanes derwentensis]SDT68119.1 Ectoine hydroxylase-related dioxygenase, phytanoyl-CoA dioxygenase (PhyH) family [Actinoplanes derwentensis]